MNVTRPLRAPNPEYTFEIDGRVGGFLPQHSRSNECHDRSALANREKALTRRVGRGGECRLAEEFCRKMQYLYHLFLAAQEAFHVYTAEEVAGRSPKCIQFVPVGRGPCQQPGDEQDHHNVLGVSV